MSDIQDLVKYLRKTRLTLEGYHTKDENVDMFMEEVLEKSIHNWLDEDNGNPELTEDQWESVRNIIFVRKNPPRTN